MGQIQTITSFVLIGLFVIAIIGFALNFAIDNDTPVNLADDSELSNLYTKTKSNVSSFESDSENTYASIIETTISPESGTAQSAAPFAITPTNALGVVKNIIEVGYLRIFGTGDGFGIFLTAFIGTLVFIIGMYVYKTLRGNPD